MYRMYRITYRKQNGLTDIFYTEASTEQNARLYFYATVDGRIITVECMG